MAFWLHRFCLMGCPWSAQPNGDKEKDQARTVEVFQDLDAQREADSANHKTDSTRYGMVYNCKVTDGNGNIIT